MACKELIFALGMIVASPLAAQPEMPPQGGAPAGAETTRYCLRVDPITGSRMETIQCRTREDWASLEVDIDKEWAENGVRVLS
jgi:hypothetical protein